MPFAENCVVVVEQLDDNEWVTRSPIEYTGKIESFVVPTGSRTDFASIPRIFVWFLPRYGRYTKAAILHDHLWRVAVPAGLSRRDADNVFRRAMRELGVPFLRRWIMWSAVRVAGMFKERAARREWWKDVPRALPFVLLGLVIVGPAATMITVALLAWLIVELLTAALLKLGQAVARLVGRNPAAKRINTPRLDWKS